MPWFGQGIIYEHRNQNLVGTAREALEAVREKDLGSRFSGAKLKVTVQGGNVRTVKMIAAIVSTCSLPPSHAVSLNPLTALHHPTGQETEPRFGVN